MRQIDNVVHAIFGGNEMHLWCRACQRQCFMGCLDLYCCHSIFVHILHHIDIEQIITPTYSHTITESIVLLLYSLRSCYFTTDTVISRWSPEQFASITVPVASFLCDRLTAPSHYSAARDNLTKLKLLS